MKRALLACLVPIVAAGAIAIAFTAVTYGGACAKLTGFPGMVQWAGMVAPGPCITTNKGTVCPSAACTTADRKPGKCKNIAAHGPVNCACVEGTVSSGLQ